MSRPVLPSTWGEGAQWTRRQVHKRRRARERAALSGRNGADFRGPAGAFRVNAHPDVTDTYRADLAKLVRDRRLGDKDGPLVRWALATIAADPKLRQAPERSSSTTAPGLCRPT